MHKSAGADPQIELNFPRGGRPRARGKSAQASAERVGRRSNTSHSRASRASSLQASSLQACSLQAPSLQNGAQDPIPNPSQTLSPSLIQNLARSFDSSLSASCNHSSGAEYASPIVATYLSDASAKQKRGGSLASSIAAPILPRDWRGLVEGIAALILTFGVGLGWAAFEGGIGLEPAALYIPETPEPLDTLQAFDVQARPSWISEAPQIERDDLPSGSLAYEEAGNLDEGMPPAALTDLNNDSGRTGREWQKANDWTRSAAAANPRGNLKP